MTRVVVTGAAGFIGSHVVEALARRGDEVVGIDNFDPFYPRAVKERNLAEVGRLPGLAFRELDLLDVDGLRSLLTPDTVLVHLAAKAGVRPSLADPVGYARVNVTGTAAIAEAARQAGVTRMLFGSSSSVYGDGTPARSGKMPRRSSRSLLTPPPSVPGSSCSGRRPDLRLPGRFAPVLYRLWSAAATRSRDPCVHPEDGRG